VVKIADSHEGFVKMCEAAVAEPDQVAGRARREDGQGQHLGCHCAKLEGHISDALAEKAERAAVKNGTQTLTAAAAVA
jgi:hypothetical protein